MARAQRRFNCKDCERKTLHEKWVFSTGWGILLTIITFGGFLLLWIPMGLWSLLKPFRCQQCGKARLV